MGRDIWLTAMGESGLRGLRFEAALLAPLMGRDDGKNGVAILATGTFSSGSDQSISTRKTPAPTAVHPPLDLCNLPRLP